MKRMIALTMILLAGCATSQPLPQGIVAGLMITLAPISVDVTVDWTCTGAHGVIGIAAENDLRIIDMTATGRDSAQVHGLFADQWFSQPWVPDVPDPVEPGTIQDFTFKSYMPGPTMLQTGHKYAISMKARNDQDQWGPLGNIHIFTASEPTGPPGAVTDVRVKIQVIVESNNP